MFLRKTLAPMAAGALLLAAALAFAPAAPAAAQEVVQDEGAAYRAWHDASQAGDNAKAMAAAKAYLEQYPTGQYGDFLKKWYGTAQMTALDAAIKEKRTADMIAVGREILAADPENLNVVYAVASQVRGEMLARPPVYDNAAAGVEFAQKGIAMVEAGKTLAGVATFDKNATLAWMTQVLALNAQKGGNAEEAISLFDKSTAYAPGRPRDRGAEPAARRRAAEQPPTPRPPRPTTPCPRRTGRRPSRRRRSRRAKDALNAEADGLIDSAASFVAFGQVQEPRRGDGRPGQPDARGRVQGALPGGRDARRPEEDPGRQGRAGAVARAPSETIEGPEDAASGLRANLFLRADRGGGAPESLSW